MLTFIVWCARSLPMLAWQTKKLYKLVKKGAKDKIVRRGVKEVSRVFKPHFEGHYLGLDESTSTDIDLLQG